MNQICHQHSAYGLVSLLSAGCVRAVNAQSGQALTEAAEKKAPGRFRAYVLVDY